MDHVNKVYALLGLPGSGKSTVSEIFKQIGGSGVREVSLGDIVREKASEEGHTTSEEIRKFATEMRNEHGKGIFAKYLVDEWNFTRPILVVDGIRSPEELTRISEATDIELIVVYVKADFETRCNRVIERKREGEGDFTEDDLKERDKGELKWGVREILLNEQYTTTINNNGSLEELSEDVLEIYQNY